jgi:hypothetical protein
MGAAIFPIAPAQILDESAEHLAEFFAGHQARVEFVSRDAFFEMRLFQTLENFCQGAFEYVRKFANALSVPCSKPSTMFDGMESLARVI